MLVRGRPTNLRSVPELSREQVVPPTALSGESLVLSRFERITNRAEQHPEAAFNNLFTLLDVELLRMAFGRLERNKAPGIDGRTVKDYEANLETNLQDLEQRLHRGSYRPLPSLCRDIPTGDGKTRPPTNAARRCPIAAVEDKLVQRAVIMVLERIYEVDFCESSFGFRPGRSCHDALGVLGKIIATKKVNWISDADIKGFFDNVNHERLVELLRTWIGDPRMLRLIERFLKAGVMIEGRRHETDDGVSQGAVLSPLLANVYLHYVLDQWFERDVKPRLKGEAHLVRYADDFICAFETESDAKRFQEVLVKRLGRYSWSWLWRRQSCCGLGVLPNERPLVWKDAHPACSTSWGLRPQSRGQIQAETENVEEEAASESSGYEGLAAKSTDGPDRGSLAASEREATRSLSVLRDQ